MNASETFDWYSNYEELKALVADHLTPATHNVLMVGCGNSSALRPRALT